MIDVDNSESTKVIFASFDGSNAYIKGISAADHQASPRCWVSAKVIKATENSDQFSRSRVKFFQDYFARMGINWGLFGGILVGLFAGFAYVQAMGLSLTAAGLIAIAIVSMVWTLTGRPRAARRHLESAKSLVLERKTNHSEFIDTSKDAALTVLGV